MVRSREIERGRGGERKRGGERTSVPYLSLNLTDKTIDITSSRDKLVETLVPLKLRPKSNAHHPTKHVHACAREKEKRNEGEWK